MFSFRESNEMPMEWNCGSYPLSLASDKLLGLEKIKSKELGKPLLEGLISVCWGYTSLALTALVLQEAKWLS